MAKGLTAIKEAIKESKSRQNSGGGNFTRKFRLDDGETAVIRFLEGGEDVVGYYAHYVDVGTKYKKYVPCRDQDMETGDTIGEDCPGCEASEARKLRVPLNIIWRNGPIFEKGDDGKIDWDTPSSFEDHVCIWEVGREVSDDLTTLEDDYKGITSRDFKVTRKGLKLDTKYKIRPADIDGGAKPLSKDDETLASEKYDLNEITAAPAYEIWGKGPKRREEEDNVPSEASAFLRKRR